MDARPRHFWSSEDRKALRILRDYFDNDWMQIVPVLNFYILSKTDATREHGIMIDTAKSQYHWITRASRISVEDLLASHPASETELQEIRRELEAMALRLGVKLHRNENMGLEASFPSHSQTELQTPSKKSLAMRSACDLSSLPITPMTPIGRRLRLRTSIEGLTTPSGEKQGSRASITCSGDSDDLQSSASANLAKPIRKRSLQSLTPPATPTRKRKIYRKTQEEMPLIGFRGVSSKSQGRNLGHDGFIAGAFVDSARIEACPSRTSERFMFEATQHVAWDKTRPSPFVSLTVSPIRAMMKARGPNNGRYLAVIDMQKLSSTSSVFSASELDLSPLNPMGSQILYHPAGEYLVWGQIKPEVVLSVVDLESLVKKPPSVPTDPDPFMIKFISTAWRRVATRAVIQKEGRMMLSFYAGNAIGQLASAFGLPSPTTPVGRAAVDRFIYDWQFKIKKHEDWQDNNIFCEGLTMGYEGRPGLEATPDRGEVVDLTGEDEWNDIIRSTSVGMDDCLQKSNVTTLPIVKAELLELNVLLQNSEDELGDESDSSWDQRSDGASMTP